MFKQALTYFTLTFVCCSCNLCGELPENLQHKVDTANAKFSKRAKLQPIPCEMIYFNIALQEDHVDTTMIHELHHILYNEEKRDGWLTLLVHDRSGKYLFSHGQNGNIYLQSGD